MCGDFNGYSITCGCDKINSQGDPDNLINVRIVRAMARRACRQIKRANWQQICPDYTVEHLLSLIVIWFLGSVANINQILFQILNLIKSEICVIQ